MTGIDGAPAPLLQGRLQPLDGPLPDVFTMFDAEFFVEWQVPDHASIGPRASAPEK